MSFFKIKNLEEKSAKIIQSGFRIELISTAQKNVNLKELVQVKNLFQKQLPKMPKEYVIRQVFDNRHVNLTIWTSKKENLVGAACFRPAYDRNLVELIFLAVNEYIKIKGYGTFLMNCFKELMKKQYQMYLDDKEGYLEKNYINFDSLNYFYKTENDIKRVKSGEEYSSDTNLYILTYADNSAIGFFKKQGFSLNPVSMGWKGFIKDYDGGHW